MELISSIVAGTVIPTLAFAAKLLLDHFLSDRTKEITVRLNGGKTETLTMAANADIAQIASELREELEAEQHVQQALKQLASRVKGVHSELGKTVDFVVQHGDRKVGIEVKNRFDSTSLGEIKRHLAAENGLSQLLLLSTKTVPKNLESKTSDLVASGQLTFVKIPKASIVFSSLTDAVEKALKVSHGTQSLH